VIGASLIVAGVVVCSGTLLAAFTPIGLIAAPIGGALIYLGIRRADRAARAAAATRKS
jgi:uncharacterized membrane protein YgdD (TMEM256/DUF423 family)